MTTGAADLIQYVVVRQDLDWPLGAVVAQGCHASVAAVAQGLEHDVEGTSEAAAADRRAPAPQNHDTWSYTKQYVDSATNLAHMRKCVLGVKDLPALQKMAEKLQTAKVPHFLWQEQPENVPTCLATWPRPKPDIQKLFKGLKLLT